MSTGFTWSKQQQDIFDWFASGAGHLVVRARAGTGKSTTILEGINHAPEPSILLCAFNKSIATELEEKLKNPRAEACTLHSAGFRIVRRMWEGVRLDANNRKWDLARAACGDDAPDEIVASVAKLHTAIRECQPLAEKPSEVADLAWKHDCIPSAEWEDWGWGEREVIRAALKARDLARKRELARKGIDFTDMIFLPVANGWIHPQYDMVVVDEAQDMNACQLAIAQGLARGRVVVVGDEKQAIYGFRGADSGSLDRLKEELKADELGLTTTYRCAKDIVALAQTLVPDYQAHEGNPAGVVTDLPTAKLVETLRPGHAVLSRVNAPLISLCLKTIRHGTAARIEGRDIAATLRKMIKDLAKGRASKSVPELLKRLESWQARELHRIQKSEARHPEQLIEMIMSKADCLRELCQGAAGVGELRGRIDDLFERNARGECVVFSSAHKAKGREWDEVFVLDDTLKSGGEEDNIAYVAYTRAKSKLTLVS